MILNPLADSPRGTSAAYPGSVVPGSPGYVPKFSFLAPGSTETTECAFPASITCATGQVLISQRSSVAYATRSDGLLMLAPFSRPRIELYNGNLVYLCEATAINRALQSNTFTSATWIKTNMTAAKTATGPDGVANSASTLTATAGNANVKQTVSLGAAATSTSLYIKRRTGTGVVNVSVDNLVTRIDITASVGASWTRIQAPAFPGLSVVTGLNPVISIELITNGDAIDVSLVQMEQTTFTSSPIETTTAIVNRFADVLGCVNPLTGNPNYFSMGVTLAGPQYASSGIAMNIGSASTTPNGATLNPRVASPTSNSTCVFNVQNYLGSTSGTPASIAGVLDDHRYVGRYYFSGKVECLRDGVGNTTIFSTPVERTGMPQRLWLGCRQDAALNSWSNTIQGRMYNFKADDTLNGSD